MQLSGAVIDGAPQSGGDLLEIVNPAGGDAAGTLSAAGEADALAAVAAARAAFPAWAARSPEERAVLVNRCADIIEANAEELARLLTLEQGKPLNGMGSRFELGGAAAWTRYTASLKLPVDTIQDDAQAHITVHRKPLGVVLSITPWNWPVMIGIWHIMPALLAGNTVVTKPSPYTPLSTMRLVQLLQDVLPPGVLNAVAGHDAIGPVLTAHPDVAKICFTGSTRTGSAVMASAAPTLKRLTLELGGNDAGIVLPDCDPAAIAEGLFWGALINNGQTCAALKRLYVHDSIYDGVCNALVDFAAGVKVGNGLEEDSILGPIQNRMQFEKVSRLVEEAKGSGARLLCGGEAISNSGYFYPVTFMANCEKGMALVDEEQFGPALPIIRYTDLDDALEQANALDVGLGGSIWSADTARARDLAMQLECGSAWVNKHGAIRPDVPFGGVKASGFGVEFGHYGLEEFSSLHVIHD
ncbi:aldehyde dehydrogenase family protein [Novosphingobium beihaiensis]|uniref:Aldehyde dehydrogenase family protein n=1 Tax=Novosphingobium beihaiensis TaxID=2930389 RepID=A0ABT0BLL3_9SPHN|nr:aldehyde dehydrogenase family protein [Novosphingobium beihaiensis]MCJ2185850.1 aldehyde dehydrogenase family protein [Novosphingobium beihaiensis]